MNTESEVGPESIKGIYKTEEEGKMGVNHEMNFCYNCGQLLDWEGGIN